MVKTVKKMYLLALVLALALTACGAVEPIDTNPMIVGVEATDTPTPTLTTTPCPITDEEIVMLAKTMTAEAQVLYWRGTQYGVSYKARQAAVGWVALNRLDSGDYGDTLAEVLSKPYQFAYDPDTETTDAMLQLASDVVERWWEEQQGTQDVGRTLPADYLFFEGDGRENYFRKEYERTGEVWDWSLPDPYQ